MRLFPSLIVSRHKRIFLVCTLLVINQTIYSLQQSSRQLARVAPRAAQAARPAATRALEAQAAALRPSLVRPMASVPALAAARPYYEQSWRQQQSGNAGPGNFGKVLSATALVTVGVLAENEYRKPLTTDQALKLVREHAHEVIEQMDRARAVQFSWLPGYIIKDNPASRKAGEKIFRDCIAEHDLDLLVVPKKIPFAVCDDDGDRCGELCLCERIEGTHKGYINVAQMRQLITLITKAEMTYYDLYTGLNSNILFTEDGKIALIDTEMGGFWPNDITSQVVVLDRTLFWCSLSSGARQLLRETIDELEPKTPERLAEGRLEQRLMGGGSV